MGEFEGQHSRAAAGGRLWKIGELAEQTGVAVATIRYYESLGLVEPARRSESGYRYYDAGAKRRLEFVKKAQTLRFSLADIRQILTMRGRKDPACPLVVAMLADKIADLEGQIARLQALKGALEVYRARWQSEDFDDPRSEHLCSLIEKVEVSPENNPTGLSTA